MLQCAIPFAARLLSIGNSLDFAICFLKGAKVSAGTAKPGPLRSRPNSQQQSNQVEEATAHKSCHYFQVSKSRQFQFSLLEHSCEKSRLEGQVFLKEK